MYDVIVIGGGASGMMAAGRAAERGKRVLLLEKNRDLGAKLKITGGGRCNICNAEENIHTLLTNFGAAAAFLYSPFSQFGVPETWAFFENRGLPLSIQENKRVFPKTEKAIDVFKVLKKYLNQGNVEIRTNIRVMRLIAKQRRIEKVITANSEFFGKNLILASGGLSHPETGATGDGFRFLKELGHTVSNPTPNIVPLAVSEAWIKSLAGVTLKDVKITFFVNNQKSFSLKGDILATHFGISGPMILNSATKVADLLEEGRVTAQIDIFPQLDSGALDKHITNIFDGNKNKILKNVLRGIVPAATSSVILSICQGINPETKIHSVKSEQRKKLGQILKVLPLTISGLMGFNRAVTADGGVTLKEIDTKTMRSLLFENLYVTGDLLDINRPSGGYSLQLCWTSGYVAGDAV